MNLSVKELEQVDIDKLLKYWYSRSPEALKAMGADITKFPTQENFNSSLNQQLAQPYDQKKAFALIWMLDKEYIGHCNVNSIEFGHSAKMHLHIWHKTQRRKGIGLELVKKSLPYFFNCLQLKLLICEPYAYNPAPNKTLEKVGFKFEKKYLTTPGSLNFEQEVNRWVLTRKEFMELFP